MAQSMFKEARVKDSKQTWRAVVIGAAVPIAMLAAAPAVSAAETVQTETVNSEQLPPLPGDLPLPGGLDPTALAKLPDLLTCVTDLLDALPADVPPVPGAPAEQLPGLPLPLPVPDPGADAPLPDIADLTSKCQSALDQLTGAVPDPGGVVPDPGGVVPVPKN